MCLTHKESFWALTRQPAIIKNMFAAVVNLNHCPHLLQQVNVENLLQKSKSILGVFVNGAWTNFYGFSVGISSIHKRDQLFVANEMSL